MQPLPIEKPSFSGHETFALRYTWLKKGFDAIERDPGVFAQEDALVRLGVGKNMVKSIRHWGIATGMLEERPGSRGRALQSTALGQAILADDGWDPYLEDPATLWVIHWHLASQPGKATTWYWLFNHFPNAEFAVSDVVKSLHRLASERGWPRLTPTSLKRDVDCCVRTYHAARQTARAVLEDSLDSPLTGLGLIRAGATKDLYLLTREARPTLPVHVFAYALADYAAQREDSARSIPLDELMHQAGAPGRVFRLAEEDLLRKAEALPEITGGAVVYDETAGLKQLRLPDRYDPISMLAAYYGTMSSKLRRAG